MAEIKTGGPAFPCEGGSESGLYADPGMTLRDYFAAKAMQGLISAHDSSGTWTAVDMNEGIAKRAYQAADAMIAAREGSAS
ncbi:hypothetical protein U2P60_14770 [Brucella sp. H1_1004]|uniref:hypothetical protein n=1 Tax=Brucella sp. H1_1004 TaxID=3110109 RepID=UPI0039B5A09E